MFVQIIQGKVADAELLDRQNARWGEDLRPGATGFLGMTGGITPNGEVIYIARFDSEANAQANSERPEQSAWWNETAKGFDGEPTFTNVTEVDQILGGGSNEAGFVQVIQGRVKDQAALRAMSERAETELKATRPDILGVSMLWHGDGGFTQVVYFASEQAARQGESAESNSEMAAEFMSQFDGEPRFLDLPNPILE